MEALPQQFRKEMMIAIPLPFIVERENKQVRAFQICQRSAACSGGRAQNGIAQRTAETFENGG